MNRYSIVVDDDIDPSDTSDVLWALGTRVHPSLRQEQWPVEILPWYVCYTEEERHSARGAIVVHDGLLPASHSKTVRPATFDSLYPEHIDWHRSVGNYFRDKLNLLRRSRRVEWTTGF